ncbi:hypothetical protein JYK14_09515 [Siccirubricoccus sp. KC 17139]|uniref:Uncharacterized protein n=1 Tax=Siccirubricoccus soli TaxID=2899147 RepID=A0ABT1D3E2_9PROT|nr:hypothetical protein [Siccirubricoccus soli]MCO6416404.1 hypothetical protein [Siccirubricoccus soli]MCP2682538.1 hypothetical protein [Siccirubricoccus soli]
MLRLFSSLLLACGLALPAAAQRAVVVGPQDQVVIAPRGAPQQQRPEPAAPATARIRLAPNGPVPMRGLGLNWSTLGPLAAAAALAILLPTSSGGGAAAGGGLGAPTGTVAR